MDSHRTTDRTTPNASSGQTAGTNATSEALATWANPPPAYISHNRIVHLRRVSILAAIGDEEIQQRGYCTDLYLRESLQSLMEDPAFGTYCDAGLQLTPRDPKIPEWLDDGSDRSSPRFVVRDATAVLRLYYQSKGAVIPWQWLIRNARHVVRIWGSALVRFKLSTNTSEQLGLPYDVGIPIGWSRPPRRPD